MNESISSFRLQGLVSAPFTAFGADGSLRPALVEKQVQSLIAQGVSGAFVCGTTGEGFSVSVDERRTVAEHWVRAAGQDLTVIVHVGHPVLSEARALAAHAEEIGAQAVAAMPTSSFKPPTVSALADYISEIAAASALPFYYYHIPSLSGVSFRVYDLLTAAAERTPTLRGCKFTYEDLMDFGRCIELEGGAFDMAFGRDEIMLPGLATGAKGFVGSTYNVAGNLYNRVIAAFELGDMAAARAAQSLAREMIAIFIQFGGLNAIKASMELTGLDCGPMRAPMTSLTTAEKDAMGAQLDAMGFFEFRKPNAKGK